MLKAILHSILGLSLASLVVSKGGLCLSSHANQPTHSSIHSEMSCCSSSSNSEKKETTTDVCCKKEDNFTKNTFSFILKTTAKNAVKKILFPFYSSSYLSLSFIHYTAKKVNTSPPPLKISKEIISLLQRLRL